MLYLLSFLCLKTGTYTSGVENGQPTALVTVFENGKLFNELTFEQVRANSNKEK